MHMSGNIYNPDRSYSFAGKPDASFKKGAIQCLEDHETLQVRL